MYLFVALRLLEAGVFAAVAVYFNLPTNGIQQLIAIFRGIQHRKSTTNNKNKNISPEKYHTLKPRQSSDAVAKVVPVAASHKI